jgi:hypothetical protein
MFVGDILNHEREREIPFISVEVTSVCVQDTSYSSGMTSPTVGDVLNLENEVFCEELHEEHEMVSDSIPLGNQAISIVVPKSNLSNFNAMLYMTFKSYRDSKCSFFNLANYSWANMTQSEEIVDYVGNTDQQFQLIVLKKRKNKFKPKNS